MPVSENYDSREFRQPENTKIDAWRYLDTSKFLSLLLFRELPLIRIDRFPDKFEGLYTRQLGNEVTEIGNRIGSHPSVVTDVVNSMTHSAEEFRRFIFASCWCLLGHGNPPLFSIVQK